ncbi:MAG TPA: hypothetical protein VEI97_18980 [bacterium]|nr:hypothetical protein [bacterium]
MLPSNPVSRSLGGVSIAMGLFAVIMQSIGNLWCGWIGWPFAILAFALGIIAFLAGSKGPGCAGVILSGIVLVLLIMDIIGLLTWPFRSAGGAAARRQRAPALAGHLPGVNALPTEWVVR